MPFREKRLNAGVAPGDEQGLSRGRNTQIWQPRPISSARPNLTRGSGPGTAGLPDQKTEHGLPAGAGGDLGAVPDERAHCGITPAIKDQSGHVGRQRVGKQFARYAAVGIKELPARVSDIPSLFCGYSALEPQPLAFDLREAGAP